MISVTNLGKRYRTAPRERYTALRDVLAQAFRGRRQTDQSEEFWALRDMNFRIEPGERVGIIGRNGAGKSTLLKLLGRITEPTQGRI